jgi:hypothetical protein
MLYQNAKRIVIFVVGISVVLIGVALIVLPGPAFIVIPAGLAILGTEFLWARRLLRKMKNQALRLTGAKPCGECGYDLRDNRSGRCPECGHPAPEASGVK